MKKPQLLLLCWIAAIPSALLAEAPATEMVPTTWTLENPPPPVTEASPGATAAPKAKAGKRTRKPRVFGGARVSNSRQKSRKAGANVGVALPF